MFESLAVKHILFCIYFSKYYIMILALLPSLTSNKTYKDTICGVEYMIYLLAPLLLIPSYQSGAIDLLLSLDSWVWILLLIHLFLSIIVLLNESTRLGFSPFLGIIKYVSIILLTILILPFSLIIFDILVFPLLTGLAIGIDLSLSTQRKKVLVNREQC